MSVTEAVTGRSVCALCASCLSAAVYYGGTGDNVAGVWTIRAASVQRVSPAVVFGH